MLLIHNRLYAEQSFSFVFGVLIYEIDLKGKWRKLSIIKQVILVICGLVIGFLFLIFKQTDIVSEENYLLYNILQFLIKFPIAVSILFGTSILIRYKVGWAILRGYGLLSPFTLEIYLIHVNVLLLLERFELSNWVYLLIFSVVCIAGVALLKVFENLIYKTGRKLLQ